MICQFLFLIKIKGRQVTISVWSVKLSDAVCLSVSNERVIFLQNNGFFYPHCLFLPPPCRQIVPGGVYQRCQKRPLHRPATPVRPQLGLPVLSPPPTTLLRNLSSSPSLLLLKQSLKSMHDGSRLSYHLFLLWLCAKMEKEFRGG